MYIYIFLFASGYRVWMLAYKQTPNMADEHGGNHLAQQKAQNIWEAVPAVGTLASGREQLKLRLD